MDPGISWKILWKKFEMVVAFTEFGKNFRGKLGGKKLRASLSGENQITIKHMLFLFIGNIEIWLYGGKTYVI